MNNKKPTYKQLEDRISKLEAQLAKTQWLYNKENIGSKEPYIPFYGDVTALNTERTILDTVGKEYLEILTSELMDLLDTSVAVYEKNGDCAYGVFNSSWCQLMDASSRNLCNTNDNKTALNCGKWLCHDDCWNNSAKPAIISKKSTDIDCPGGIRLFAEPIFVGSEVIGVINIGYGNPPDDDKSLKELSKKYSIDFDTLKQKAKAYNPRPDFIIEIAKKRLKSIAQLIGEIVSHKTAKDKAEASEKKLKSVSDNMLDLVAVTDLQGNFKFTGASHKILGYDIEWLIGKNVMDFVHPDDLPTVQSDFISFIENRMDKATSTYRYLCADGSYLWFETFETFIFDENDNPIEILFNTRDVTERKQAEQALKKSEQKLNLIINKSPFPAAISDISNEIIRYWSQNAKKMFGHMPATVSEWYELAYPDPEYRKKAIERWKPYLETTRESDTAINTGEYHITCKDGSVKICEIFAQYIPDNIVVTFNDVTERKKAEQALKQSEANLQFLNTMVNEAFNLKDLNSIYDYISSKLSEILPNTIILFLTIDSKNEENHLENFHGINNQFFKKILNIMPFNPVGKNFKLLPDYKALHKTGKLIEFKNGLAEFSKSHLSSLTANSIEKIIGLHKIYSIGILRGENLLANFHFFTFNKTEITNAEFIEAYVKQAGLILQIKQAELKLEEANVTKDRFISILGHDLRSPFNTLLGFSNLLVKKIDQYDKEKIKKQVQAINKTAKQTFNLLNNLLEWSRSQQNEIPFNPQTTNLYFLINETYLLLNDSAEAKQISIELDLSEEINAKVDSEMIKTVIRNLLSNAIKFTLEGGTINVSASQNQKYVKVEISDTGTGMDSETLNSLFKIGKIESKHGTKGERGTGFGLLLCKEFVEKHGGKIWAESDPDGKSGGKGSDFKFTLPTGNI